MNRYHGNKGGMTNGQNNLLNQYNRHVSSSVPFASNPMLNNNPLYIGSIRDPNFCNKMNMAKIEQIKRAKRVDDFGMDKKQMMEYIICPMTVNKSTSDEILKLWKTFEDTFMPLKEEWQRGRTNQPYKNILKNENYKKTFKTKDDLIVHKVTDADKLGLLEDYEKLMAIIEKHNDHLSVIYSTSERNKHKKEFEYVQKYKYRLKYDPKDFDELKDFYKKEQKKISKEKRKIDEILNSLVENDILDSKDIEKLDRELNEEDTKKLDVRNIEDELREELGEDFDEIMRQLESDDSDEEEKPLPSKKKILVKTEQKDEKPSKKKITVKSTSKNPSKSENVVVTDDDIKSKYKNRGKK
jgi:hypothetical protein